MKPFYFLLLCILIVSFVIRDDMFVEAKKQKKTTLGDRRRRAHVAGGVPPPVTGKTPPALRRVDLLEYPFPFETNGEPQVILCVPLSFMGYLPPLLSWDNLVLFCFYMVSLVLYQATIATVVIVIAAASLMDISAFPYPDALFAKSLISMRYGFYVVRILQVFFPCAELFCSIRLESILGKDIAIWKYLVPFLTLIQISVVSYFYFNLSFYILYYGIVIFIILSPFLILALCVALLYNWI
jgi:hypothetical protein